MMRDFSELLHGAMDCLGYSVESIALRSKMFKKGVEICSEKCTERYEIDLIIAGSKGEGTVLPCGSDFDFMQVLTHYVCVDDGCKENGLSVIQNYADHSPPGYTKLRPLDIDEEASPLSYMCSVYDLNKGVVLLSSTALRTFVSLTCEMVSFYQGIDQDAPAVNGPAVTIKSKSSLINGVKAAEFSNDQVPAIRYYSSSILEKWKKRKRVCEWPPSDVQEEVSVTEGYVVPIGHKLSEEQNFEWRICYTTAEQKLISSFNEVQMKLYVLLKIVNKTLIEPNVDCVSSYMLKNIVFWIAECTPVYEFTPSSLTHRLVQCLYFLLHCLYNNFLPNYMIPERNLFHGKVTSGHKHKLKSVLQELLNDGERIVLRCEKLRNAMFIMDNNPSVARRFRVWRDEVEELLLFMNMTFISKVNPQMMLQSSYLYDVLFEYWKDESYINAALRLLNLLSIDIPKFLGDGLQGVQDYTTWVNRFFSD